MRARSAPRGHSDGFQAVRKAALTLPRVEEAIRYDGSPVLRLGGAFMAGLAVGDGVEPATLVVRVGIEERAGLLEDAPDTYYLTEYHRPHPVVLVRLSRIDADALRDLLSMSWRATLPKARPRIRSRT